MTVDEWYWFNWALVSILGAFILSLFIAVLWDVSRVVRKNLDGQYAPDPTLYCWEERKGKKHVQLHKQMKEHSHNHPFYCNTFTGFRRISYDFLYSVIRTRRMKQARKAHETDKAATKAERRKLQNSQERALSSRMKANKERQTRKQKSPMAEPRPPIGKS